MLELTLDPLFGFSLCLLTYSIGLWVNKKIRSPLASPMLIAAALAIAVLIVFKIPLENFMAGANFVTMFLAPVTAALATTIYKNLEIIKKNCIPILVGAFVGATSAVFSVIVLCKVLNIPEDITASLIPKSITSAFALKLSAQLGGIPAITMAALAITGILGTMSAPFMIKVFRVNNPIASGLAIGACSHALGTSKAIEIGELEGTLSGIAVGICGLITVFIAIFL